MRRGAGGGGARGAETDFLGEGEGHEREAPGEVPAGAGNAAWGWGTALHPQRPTTGARRGEGTEGEFPQGKAVGLVGWRGSCLSGVWVRGGRGC